MSGDSEDTLQRVRDALLHAQTCMSRDPNEETRQYTERLIQKAKNLGDSSSLSEQNEDIKDLLSRFEGRLQFGTAGLRGPMGAGSMCMNDLTVIQATQGLISYLLMQFGSEAKSMGVVLGYDHRTRGSLSSKHFAALAARALRLKDFKVYLADRIVCTPWVPFMVEQRAAGAGVMITASHNPKEDNGYKVYWANGSQIIPPHDKGIAAQIDASQEPWDIDQYKNTTFETITKEVDIMFTEESIHSYLDTIRDKLRSSAEANVQSKKDIVYTAMHGVGTPFVQAIFERFNLPPPILVEEQCEPDANFSTIKFPNPEEGKGALSLAMKRAEEKDASIIFANDPDADRLALAEKLSERAASRDNYRSGNAGDWRVFTGNEIAAMLASWQWKKHNAKHGSGKDYYMLASTVSSKMIREMARKEGFNFVETLTGFKWMGNKAADLEKEGKTVGFAFEEAIGFCVGDVVKDKDGVSAAAVFGEIVAHLSQRGISISEYMSELYETYGHFITNNKYLFVDDAKKTKAIFRRLYNEGHYWHTFGRWAIQHIRDLTSPGIDTSQSDNKPVLPVSSSSYMVTYTLSNGCVITLRTSGTEPKLKYYCEYFGESPEETEKELNEIVEAVIAEMLQPEVHGLKRPEE
eukprot:gb/GECG01001515.1/.p1 GENE.gb/GECG01001515.1/~~gb/GECG01001515.1/.p1  ORF type:complete len:634 (+),score=86.05 gb/GECG01001515.1/:1-1902(+)